MIENRRFQNLSDYEAYKKAVKNRELHYMEEEVLSAEDEMEEFMFLGLRMANGISRIDFQENFGKSLEEVYGNTIRKLKEQRLLNVEKDRIFLTKRGVDISNYVFEQFLV